MLCSLQNYGLSLSLFLCHLFALHQAGVTDKELDVSLNAELFLHDVPSFSRRRKLKSSNVELPPECRVMSLTAFPLATLLETGDALSLSCHHYVAVGCSDAVVRYVELVIAVVLCKAHGGAHV